MAAIEKIIRKNRKRSQQTTEIFLEDLSREMPTSQVSHKEAKTVSRKDESEDEQTSELNVPAINWSKVASCKTIKYIKMGQAPIVDSARRRGMESRQNSPRCGKELFNRLGTSNERDRKRRKLIKNNDLPGKRKPQRHSRRLSNVQKEVIDTIWSNFL